MYTDMDGLGKFKLFKKKKKRALAIAPAIVAEPITVAPAIAEPVTVTPTDRIYQPMPYGGFYPTQQRPQPMPQASQYIEREPSARAIPEDFYSTGTFDYKFDAGEPAASNTPIVTPYESAASSIFGTEEDFMDTSAAYESEAGYLNGLGQESGSTGGWFSDLISTGTKAYSEIAKAKAAAKSARVPAPIFSTYKPGSTFGSGFNLNTALMIGALGLGGFLLYSKFVRKRR